MAKVESRKRGESDSWLSENLRSVVRLKSCCCCCWRRNDNSRHCFNGPLIASNVPSTISLSFCFSVCCPFSQQRAGCELGSLRNNLTRPLLLLTETSFIKFPQRWLKSNTFLQISNITHYDWLKASTGYGGLVTKHLMHLIGAKINFSQSKTLYLTQKHH